MSKAEDNLRDKLAAVLSPEIANAYALGCGNTMTGNTINEGRDLAAYQNAAINQILALLQTSIKEAEVRARRGMLEYFDQVPSNEAVDWKGLLKDVRSMIETEERELQQSKAKGEEDGM